MCLLTLFFVASTLGIQVSAKSVEHCPPLYLRYSTNPSYCKPVNSTCDVLKHGIVKEDIAIILQEHNIYRNNIATGVVKNMPKASNMLQMEWDSELASLAQKHAFQCMFEHDCSNCRRVQNFGVGQNLAVEIYSNTPSRNPPKHNWPKAIKSWYDEIAIFPINAVKSFFPPPPDPTYGHFTQMIWAESWRIGCGYVSQRRDKEFEHLYVCNYGPAGNLVSEGVYKEGAPCSQCPLNSCCGKQCSSKDLHYSGLCKITDGKAPNHSPGENFIFYCSFSKEPDCNYKVIGVNKWSIYKTLSGNFLGIILKGGEESTIRFSHNIKPSTPDFCFAILYRKGPNAAGQEEDNTATEVFTITDVNYEVKQTLPQFDGDAKQQFSQFSMSLSWKDETEFQLTFSVPAGKPDQFLEVQRLFATEGPCKQ